MARGPRDAAARPRLTRERVLQAAVDLADEIGIEALTMRRLGGALGVEAMSLYNHVTNKDDILAGMLDIVVARFDLSGDAADWKAAIRRGALSAREELTQHPWAGTLMLTAITPGPARLSYMDWSLARYREGGFSVEMAHHALHAVDGHVTGYAIQQAIFPVAAHEAAAVAAAFLRQLDVEAFPYLAEHIRYHVDVSGMSDAADFEFGLDLILDGLERLQAGVSASAGHALVKGKKRRPRRSGAAHAGKGG